MRSVIVVALSVLLLSWQNMAVAGSVFYITFATVDCSGETGFVSAEMDRLVRIVPSDCTDPDKPGEKLKQLHLRSDLGGASNIEIYTITAGEMKSIQQQITDNRAARRKMVEQGKSVLIEKE